jgi:hypothetical protein
VARSSKSVLIVDEAQTSYWDLDFWLGFVKPISSLSSDCVIAFAGYGGSAGRSLVEDPQTPFWVQGVSLVALDHGDNFGVGLLLTELEFSALVNKVLS